MKSSPILVAIFLCAASSTSIAQNTADSTRPSSSASEFVAKAGAGGLAEVEMGELGVQKATSGQVKAFAKRIVTDHTKANEQLVTVIKGKGLQVPSSQSATHKAMMDKFRQRTRERISTATTWSKWSRTTRSISNCSRPPPTMQTGCRAACLRKEDPADVARPSETGADNRRANCPTEVAGRNDAITRLAYEPLSVPTPQARDDHAGGRSGLRRGGDLRWRSTIVRKFGVPLQLH